MLLHPGGDELDVELTACGGLQLMSAKPLMKSGLAALCLACVGALLTLAACDFGAPAPPYTPPAPQYPPNWLVPTQAAQIPVGTPADAVITATASAAIGADNAGLVDLLQTVQMGKPVDRVAFSGKTTNPIAAGMEGKSVHVWAKPGTAFVTLAQPEKTVTSLSLTPDGRTLTAGSEDGRAYIWSLSDLKGKPRSI